MVVILQFKTELRKLKQRYKKAGRVLAKESKISNGALSRMISGKARPSLKLMRKLLAVTEVEDGSKILAAYLNDVIPVDLREHVGVYILAEGEAPLDPLVRKILALRPEVRIHVEHIIEELLHPGSEHTPIINLTRRLNKS